MKPKPDISYPIIELLENRWSPRAFSDKPIEHEKIMSLFEAARWAASAMNEQPWRFIYAEKTDPKKYAKMFSCLVDANKIWAASAPLLVITFIKTQIEKNNEINKWAMHDLGLAIGNLTTQASAMEIFIHNMGGFSKETVKELFIIPAVYEPVTMIAMGYIGHADQLPEKLRERELNVRNRIPFDDLFIG
jgi:nitroreductase